MIEEYLVPDGFEPEEEEVEDETEDDKDEG